MRQNAYFSLANPLPYQITASSLSHAYERIQRLRVLYGVWRYPTGHHSTGLSAKRETLRLVLAGASLSLHSRLSSLSFRPCSRSASPYCKPMGPATWLIGTIVNCFDGQRSKEGSSSYVGYPGVSRLAFILPIPSRPYHFDVSFAPASAPIGTCFLQ